MIPTMKSTMWSLTINGRYSCKMFKSQNISRVLSGLKPKALQKATGMDLRPVEHAFAVLAHPAKESHEQNDKNPINFVLFLELI